MPIARRLKSNGRAAARDSKAYERKLEAILRQAAAVFCARGYHHASIRDIARATGISLAGLYYYFSSKEELLYLIQRHAFETILSAARAGLEGIETPEERLRALIRLHLHFFLEHPNEMKVLTHEEQWLSSERARGVRAIKRAYYQLCFDQVQAVRRERSLAGLNTRLAVLSLFGMMNWIYTWYNPKFDPDATTCAEVMAGIFLDGILTEKPPSESTVSAESASMLTTNGHHSEPRRPKSRIARPSQRESVRVEATEATFDRSGNTEFGVQI
jgi:AcrR family transcriptional regulator